MISPPCFVLQCASTAESSCRCYAVMPGLRGPMQTRAESTMRRRPEQRCEVRVAVRSATEDRSRFYLISARVCLRVKHSQDRAATPSLRRALHGQFSSRVQRRTMCSSCSFLQSPPCMSHACLSSSVSNREWVQFAPVLRARWRTRDDHRRTRREQYCNRAALAGSVAFSAHNGRT